MQEQGRGGRRGRLTRLDDVVLGRPGTRRGWWGDLYLGIHPWLRPIDALLVLAGLAMAAYGVVRGESGLIAMGIAWSLIGVLYLYVSRGKSKLPPPGK